MAILLEKQAHKRASGFQAVSTDTINAPEMQICIED